MSRFVDDEICFLRSIYNAVVSCSTCKDNKSLRDMKLFYPLLSFLQVTKPGVADTALVPAKQWSDQLVLSYTVDCILIAFRRPWWCV